MNFYTEEGINQAIETAKSSYDAVAMAILSANDTAEEVKEKMTALRTMNDIFVNAFKDALFNGRGGRASIRKER